MEVIIEEESEKEMNPMPNPQSFRIRRTQMVLALAMALSAGLLAALLAKPAWAEDTVCTGVLSGYTKTWSSLRVQNASSLAPRLTATFW